MTEPNEMAPFDDHRSNGTEHSVASTGCCACEGVVVLVMVSGYGRLAASGMAADADVQLEDAPMVVVETLVAPRSERSRTIWHMSNSLSMIVARRL